MKTAHYDMACIAHGEELIAGYLHHTPCSVV
jgi:hypothetical protein